MLEPERFAAIAAQFASSNIPCIVCCPLLMVVEELPPAGAFWV